MKPLLIDIPVPIETANLILRPPMAGDGPELNAAIRESFEELQPWIPWADKIPTLEESEENVRLAHAKWILREDLRLTAIDKATGKFAAGTGLHRVNWSVRCFEIGYWVRKCFYGKGYAYEAAHALTRLAFEKLDARRVELRCDPENTRSIAVIKKLGYEFEGCLKKNALRAGSKTDLRDTLVFARLNLNGLPEIR